MGDDCKQTEAVSLQSRQTAPGVPAETIQQFLLRMGIYQKADPPGRGGYVQDFGGTLDLTRFLNPIERGTEVVANNTIGGTSVSVTINPPDAETIRVIRTLQMSFGQTSAGIPDRAFVAAIEKDGTTKPIFLNYEGIMPASKIVIGDCNSPLTEKWIEFLPYAMIQGSGLQFTVSSAVAGDYDCRVFYAFEDWTLPLRPETL